MTAAITLKTFTEDSEVAHLLLDLPGEKINKLSTPVMQELKAHIDSLARSNFKAVVISSAKPSIFIAGADIEEIKDLKTKEAFLPAVAAGQEIFNALEDLPMPVIAAIHGACAGGGCELVLACDFRICSDDSSTRIGLPETKLGIIPGFGGCIRLPRTIGLPEALDIILGGKLVAGKKALRIGLVDKMVHKNLLLEEGLKIARANKGKKRQAQFRGKGFAAVLHWPLVRNFVFANARNLVMKTTNGHYPAPLAAIDVIQKTFASQDRKASLEIERSTFVECAVTPISKNLIHVYFLIERSKKADVGDFSPVENLGVLGAGTMGGGIAYVAADKGIRVRLRDLSLDAIGKGFKAAYDLWKKQVDRKQITSNEMHQKMSRVSGGLDEASLGQMDVVVEAIVEDMAIKQRAITSLAKILKPTSLIATNTSSLSVTKLAEAHPHPENFVGMHFFNPVHRMPLVEIIRGPKTSAKSVSTIFQLALKIGKTPVIVKDGPGFLVNRLLLPYLIEATFLAEQGMALDLVDRALVKKFGMPMGPFELMDEIGLDVCAKVVKIFHEAFGDRIETPKTFFNLIEKGRLGKKNRRGFYIYTDKGQRQSIDQSIYTEMGLSHPTNPMSEDICIDRCILAIVNEAAIALKTDQIVGTADEVDLAMIMGTGFPPFRGGPLKFADSVGLDTVRAKLESFGLPRLRPSSDLIKLKSFY